jgi:hypothetical protein
MDEQQYRLFLCPTGVQFSLPQVEFGKLPAALRGQLCKTQNSGTVSQETEGFFRRETKVENRKSVMKTRYKILAGILFVAAALIGLYVFFSEWYIRHGEKMTAYGINPENSETRILIAVQKSSFKDAVLDSVAAVYRGRIFIFQSWMWTPCRLPMPRLGIKS